MKVCVLVLSEVRVVMRKLSDLLLVQAHEILMPIEM